MISFREYFPPLLLFHVCVTTGYLTLLLLRQSYVNCTLFFLMWFHCTVDDDKDFTRLIHIHMNGIFLCLLENKHLSSCIKFLILELYQEP